MVGGITKEDIEDVEIVDAEELSADGSTNYTTGATVVSTTSSTKKVVFSSIDLIYDKDERAEVNDILILTGTSGGGAADGTYTIASVDDQTSVTVVETIADSTGGTADFRHPAGATKVGVDPTNITASTQNDLQGVLEDLDGAIGAGGITEAQHKALRALIHFIDNGPADGFTSGAYREMTGTVFPTAVIWWESSSKLKKIVEKTITWTGINPTTIVWKMYDTDGSTVLATVSDAISYSGVFETNRTRTIT